jgi:hypothetical protein
LQSLGEDLEKWSTALATRHLRTHDVVATKTQAAQRKKKECEGQVIRVATWKYCHAILFHTCDAPALTTMY